MSIIRAVIVGSNQCKNGSTPSLRFAEADAIEFSRRLSAQTFYARADINLVNSTSTAHDILELLQVYSASSSPEDCLILYFAGHGISEIDDQDEANLYLAYRNTDLEQVTNTGISLLRVVHLFEKSPAGIAIIILDCCFSGRSGGRSLLGPHYLRKLQTGRAIGRSRIQAPIGSGRVVLSACGQHQIAVESATMGHGVFTYALLNALRSSKREHSISVAQLYYLVQRDVLERTSGRQCPSLYGGDHGAHMPTI